MARIAKRTSLFVIFALLLALPFAVTLAQNPATELTTTNQDLTAEVTLDTTDDPVWAGTSVAASATANLGEGDFANIIYVLDASGSMVNPNFNPPEPGLGDCDGDGLLGTAMDAACLGLISLNESLGDADNVSIGLVAYGSTAKTGDMDPAAGQQTFTSPPDVDNNNNSTPDVEEVIRSVVTEFGGGGAQGGIGLFTPDISASFPGGTNYNAALSNMNASFASQPAGDINTAIFMSDGDPTAFSSGAGSPLQGAVDAGTVIHTFGVGGGAANSCAAGAPLRQIADQTGGSCTEVSDPANLSTELPAALTNIASLEILVNGSVVGSTAGSAPVSMALNNVDITGALSVGQNTIEARATAEDGTVAIASTTLGVIDLDLSPAEATNELGESNTHQVVATIAGNPSQVEGILVDFEVQGQNAGAAGDCDPADCRTDAAGQVSFTYSVPVAPSSLGTDSIHATATSEDGQESSASARKHWEDTTPPVPSCVESVNPHGQNTPRAGQNSPGQNEDGFYQLLAEDDVWPVEDLQMFVVDSGSGVVFGPYDVGTVIKYTQAPGAEPNEKTMGSNNGQAGAVTVHITGNGDAEVYAVDGSGNASDPVDCLVPPPPQ